MTVRWPEGLRGTAAARDTVLCRDGELLPAAEAGGTAAHATLEDPSRASAIILGTAINLVGGLGAGGALGRWAPSRARLCDEFRGAARSD